MIKKIGMLLVSLYLGVLTAQAQKSDLHIPREIKRAYEKGTRSYDGKPGPNYWQNTVDYKIDVAVDPKTRELTGSEEVVFNNNSPDDLTQLILRIYHDVFREGNQRGSRVRPSDVNDGVEISKLVIDGNAIDMTRGATRQGTNLVIRLPKPIAKNSSATIEVDWKMVIPETTVRTGAYDSTSYFVSYWYPQVAVYDDVFGWDRLSYDFSTEFYNNLGNFEVNITVPKNFTVMATGTLQNPEQVFKADKLSAYQKANSSNETVTIVSVDDVNNGYSHQSGTWKYKADEVTDFSFCMSDHFVWDAAVQKVANRNVLISTFYNVSVAAGAAQLTSTQQKTMKHFSEDVPGIPYPYPEFTTCVMGIGGGGMETPMMANNGQPGRGVTIHEMFHTYFPMYVRVNEKRFAWMDEGWADFNTSYVSQRYFQQDTSLFVEDFANSVQGTLGTISDLPLITSTQFMDNSNYGYASYPLPAFMYSILHHHLGDDLFRKCYSEYINTWAKKSPTPYDFFYTFERVSGQDLSWFWKPWFFNYGDVDVQIASFKKGNLKIANKGTRPVPVVISVLYKDSTTWSGDYSAKSWGPDRTMTKKLPKYKEIASLVVNGSFPDAEILDNFQPTLQEQFKDFKLSGDYFGEYQAKEFPVTVDVSNRKELVFVGIPGTGLQSYMRPTSENSYESLDKSMKISFKKNDNGKSEMVLQILAFGITLSGEKQ